MPLLKKTAGAWGPAQAKHKIDVAWQPANVWKKVAGAWVLQTSTMSVSAPDPDVEIDTTATVTSNSITAVATGGTAPIGFAWAKISGDSIVATAPGSAATAFRASTMAVGETRSAIFRVTATDANGITATDDVAVTLKRAAALTATAAPPSLSASGNASSVSTVNVTVSTTGGTAPIDFTWAKVSGATLTVSNPGSATTKFTAAGLAPGETRTAVYRCTTADSNGLTDSVDVSVTISRYATLTASASPASLSATGSTATVSTGTAKITASASGGKAPYDFTCAKTSGGAISASSPGSAATAFSASALAIGEERTAQFRWAVTDSLGQEVSTSAVSVTIKRTGSSAVFSPPAGDYAANSSWPYAASLSLVCNQTATWNWTRTGDISATASLASGGSGTSIAFSMAAGGTDKTAEFDVTATTADGGTAHFTVTLTALGKVS